ncbi:unnamed protein product [Brachionus calyciflorus]|uniref:Uncharacterized protein n=1 Tax=Brachionus calyciflorus TaxID=104777 RepID=A0A814EZI2_9BILA|nr:unnamed protein product [Brachionus calyciflorus]
MKTESNNIQGHMIEPYPSMQAPSNSCQFYQYQNGQLQNNLNNSYVFGNQVNGSFTFNNSMPYSNNNSVPIIGYYYYTSNVCSSDVNLLNQQITNQQPGKNVVLSKDR